MFFSSSPQLLLPVAILEERHTACRRERKEKTSADHRVCSPLSLPLSSCCCVCGVCVRSREGESCCLSLRLWGKKSEQSRAEPVTPLLRRRCEQLLTNFCAPLPPSELPPGPWKKSHKQVSLSSIRAATGQRCAACHEVPTWFWSLQLSVHFSVIV